MAMQIGGKLQESNISSEHSRKTGLSKRAKQCHVERVVETGVGSQGLVMGFLTLS